MHEQPAQHPPFADDREAARWWLANVYAGDDAVQLTPRAVITGMLIGGVMSISNLYVGLKTGWGLGVTITASIIAYALFTFLERIVPAWRSRPFSTLENYTMSSAASAAGYMSSAGLVSALPALYLTTGRLMQWWEIMLWLGALSMLGVFMAIPLKRQLINVDQLPFPSGIATAETLRSLHSSESGAPGKAKALLFAAVLGAVVAEWSDLFPHVDWLKAYALPGELPLLPTAIGHELLSRYTIGIEGSLIMLAAGAIMGLRVATSMLVGSILCFGVIGPILVEQGITKPGYRGIVSWVLWPSTAMMVTAGLLSFAIKWRTVLRAFGGLSRIFDGGRGHEADDDALAHVEVPFSWFVVGVGLAGTACVVLGHVLFGITWWMGVLAVVVTFLLSIVAARATGETDITPIGAMGKITQLLYGVIAPSNLTTNIMTACITSGAASHAADLLTDLKSGYLLGGNPRKQTISQLFGVIAGTVISVPAYIFVVQANPDRLGSPDLPAPAAKVWQGVAQLLAKGLEALPAGALTAILIGIALGVVFTLLEEFALKPLRARMPAFTGRIIVDIFVAALFVGASLVWLISSTTGLAIAGVIPAFNSIAMFVGAFIATVVAMVWPKAAEAYTVPISSGLIAGESLMGVAIIFDIEILRACGMWVG